MGWLPLVRVEDVEVVGPVPMRVVNFDDYPPGTPLPELPWPDRPEASDRRLRRIRRRARKMHGRHMLQLELARDDFWRRRHGQ